MPRRPAKKSKRNPVKGRRSTTGSQPRGGRKKSTGKSSRSRSLSETAASDDGRPAKRTAKKKRTATKRTATKGPTTQRGTSETTTAKRSTGSDDKSSGGKRSGDKSSGGKSSGGKKRSGSAASAAVTRDQPQRLQRLLATAGFGSRRQCESLIEEGRVEVDGQLVSELGTVVDPQTAKVRVDGVPLRQQKLVYYAVNKPVGVLSTNSDPRGRQRVIDLVPNSERVFSVGRLDQSSQGLMLLTNDGDLAQQLTHPRYGIRKVYRVTVAGKIDGETMRNMRKGIYISEGFVRVEGARILKSRARATELEIMLREGKNREIRRILARLGHKVQVLRRIAIGPLRLGDLPVGAYRPLSRDEVRRLRMAIEHSREEVRDEAASRSAGPSRSADPSRSAAAKTPKGRGTKKKRAGGRRQPETRSDVKNRRTRRKTKATKVSFKPRRSDGGSVIGGD